MVSSPSLSPAQLWAQQSSAPSDTPSAAKVIGGEGAAAAAGEAAIGHALSVLIDALPADDTRPAQTQFDLAAQVVFLEALATTGSVRSASRKARSSHQSVYRARRACAAFRRAWDAALLAAREAAVAELADRAMNGVEEEVYYHGEVVASRRRFDPRLLLAHLARLDKLADNLDIAALAEDFDDMLQRFGRGEGVGPRPSASAAPAAGERENCAETPEGQAARPGNRGANRRADQGADQGTGGFFSQEGGPGGPCLDPEMRQSASPCAECGGGCNGPEADLTAADCQWLGNRLDRMDEARPADAPTIYAQQAALLEQGHVADVGAIEVCQLRAFEAGEAQWWLRTGPEIGNAAGLAAGLAGGG